MVRHADPILNVTIGRITPLPSYNQRFFEQSNFTVMEDQIQEPINLEEAIMDHNQSREWWEAMIMEIWCQDAKGTWKEMKPPHGRKPLNSGGVFKIKSDGALKARLVIK